MKLRDPSTGRFAAMQSAADRFFEKVSLDEDLGCWLWQGFVRPDGYGTLRLGSRNPFAHRVAYELLVEPIPKGLVLDHLCEVRHCVNPGHVQVVTPRVNATRGLKTNAQKRTCLRGHPFNEQNTYRYKGGRYCRACRSEQHRAYLERRQAS